MQLCHGLMRFPGTLRKQDRLFPELDDILSVGHSSLHKLSQPGECRFILHDRQAVFEKKDSGLFLTVFAEPG